MFACACVCCVCVCVMKCAYPEAYFEIRIYVFGQCTDMRNVGQYIGRFYNRNVDGSVEKEHLILLMVYQDFH